MIFTTYGSAYLYYCTQLRTAQAARICTFLLPTPGPSVTNLLSALPKDHLIIAGYNAYTAQREAPLFTALTTQGLKISQRFNFHAKSWSWKTSGRWHHLLTTSNLNYTTSQNHWILFDSAEFTRYINSLATKPHEPCNSHFNDLASPDFTGILNDTH